MRGVEGPHVVRTQVGPSVDHAAFQPGDVKSWTLGPGVQEGFNAVPVGLVVPSCDDQRAPRVHFAAHLDWALGHANGQPVLEHGGQRRRARVRVVAHQERVRGGFLYLQRRLGVHDRFGRPRCERWQGRRQSVGLQSVDIGKGPSGDVVGQAVAQLRIGVHQHLEQARHGLVRVENQVARLHGHFGGGHGPVIQPARFGRLGGGLACDAVGLHQVRQPRELGGIVGLRDHVGGEVPPWLLGIATVIGREFFQHAVGVRCR